MSVVDAIASAIGALVPADHRPVVVYASAWPFLRQMGRNDRDAVEAILTAALDALGDRTVLMPTFTRGFVHGVCDLDREPSITGVMTECFRTRQGVRRTLSGFFSFGVCGDRDQDLLDLTPDHTWGPGSCYEWMERRDVHLLMLGTHPTQCSYLHRLEWLARDVIGFRSEKSFSGRLVREGVTHDVTETLFVRRLDPPVVMDFRPLEPGLRAAGMMQRMVAGGSIATYDAGAAITHTLPLLRRDPWAIVKNRQEYHR
jgi:aminoglycoside N3'-acetyltransferase